MAKDAKTAATKGRETKLSKKSYEELIEIILRKDKTERNLNAQIVNLKSEVNTLNERIKNIIKDFQGCEQALSDAKDRLNTANEKSNSYAINAADYKISYEKELKLRIEKEEQIKLLNKIVGIAVLFSIIALLSIFFS